MSEYGFTNTLWLCLTRTCNLDCVYSASPDTPVLMRDGTWRPIASLKEGDALWSFDEHRPGEGLHRKMRAGIVRRTWEYAAEAYRLVHDDGEVVLGTDHRLVDGVGRWCPVSRIRPGRMLRLLAGPMKDEPETDAYRVGYVCGIFEGDGTLGVYRRPDNNFTWSARLAMNDREAVERAQRFAGGAGVALGQMTYYSGGPSSYVKERALMPAIRAKGRASVARLAGWISQPREDDREWLRGWIGGMFDAEGSYAPSGGGALRIFQNHEGRRERILRALHRLGFAAVEEAAAVRLIGGISEALRFYAIARPALLRKLDLNGVAPRNRLVKVRAVEKIGRIDLADISVADQPTYYAAGFPSHNCYQGSHAVLPKETPSTREPLLKYMPRSVVERAAPWAAEWTDSALKVCFYGGEPLLSWPLIRETPAILGAAFEGKRDLKGNPKSVSYSITTNGTLLKPEVRDWLDENKVGVLLSLDGPPWLHDQSRVYYDTTPDGKRRGSWRTIPVDDVLAWRPNVEIAWQISPRTKVAAKDLDWMVDYGFKSINFNLDWMVEWPDEARQWLQDFFKHAGRRMIRGEFGSNWFGKIERALEVDEKMVQPCGTGLRMLGLSPEGWLYPSQEMVYNVVNPAPDGGSRAPNTERYYRVGDVGKEPVIDRMALARVSIIKTSQMRPPPPFMCENCVARSASIGGCHCRLMGADGVDPANRFDVLPGYCQSMTAAMTGLLQAAAIERWVRPTKWIEARAQPQQPGACAHGTGASPIVSPGARTLAVVPSGPQNGAAQITLRDVSAQIAALSRKIDEIDVVRLEAVKEA